MVLFGTQPHKTDLWSDSTSEERVVLEVLDPVLTQPVLSAADESTDQVLGLLRHVSHLLGELESLLGGKAGHSVKIPAVAFYLDLPGSASPCGS